MFAPAIALYRPQIPPNTGNIARLCVGLNLPLYIVGKAAFSWDAKQLQRAGLDYWNDLQFQHFRQFKEFFPLSGQRRVVTVTKEGSSLHWDFRFRPDDILLFGNETAGLPPRVLTLFADSIRLPMLGNIRSLNLSNAAAVIAYEALRQQYQTQPESLELMEKKRRREYYKKPLS